MAAVALTIRDYTSLPGEYDAATFTWLFPMITTKNSHGKDITWRVFVRGVRPRDTTTFIDILPELQNKPSDVYGWISVASGVTGGVTRAVTPTIVTTGKNIGKKSATNPVCQAMRDALSLHNKQLKKYTDNYDGGAPPAKRYPPMLAQVYSQQIEQPTEKVYLQRKYNGVRSVACLETINGIPQVSMYSRTKGTYPGLDYIKAELLPILTQHPTYFLDGEIYKHGAKLQDISGQARRGGEYADADKLNYFVYDMFDSADMSLPYHQRKQLLDALGLGPWVRCVETEYIEPADIDQYYRRYLLEGYEGAMVRIADKPYQPSDNGRHSKYLLKIKETLDHEYKVVDWTTGDKGKAASALMIICEVIGVTGEAIRFPVTPAMTLDERNALAALMPTIENDHRTHFENHYKDTMIIVYYDEISRDGVPQRARTKLEKRVD